MTRSILRSGALSLPSFRQLPHIVIAIAAMICAALILADTLYLTIRYFQPVFVYDPWLTVRDYKAFKEGTYRLSDLFAQHNEHRIAIPRLVFYADFALGSGLNIINIAAIYLIQTLHAVLFIAIALRVSHGFFALIAVCAIIILLFSFGQSDNLTFGFQVQFVGVFAAASLSFFLFAEATAKDISRRSSRLRVIGAAASAVVATLMMSNGVLALIVLPLLAAVARAGRLIVIALGLFAAATILAYVHNAHFGGTPASAARGLDRILGVTAYALIYLGGVMGASGLVAAGTLGFAGCGLATLATLQIWRRWNRDKLDIALVGIMIFVIATAVVTAWGRFSFGLPQALESRYLTPVAVFWAAQVTYWSSRTQPPAQFWSGAFFMALSATVMFGAIERHLAQRPSAKWNFMDEQRAADALLSGIHAADVMRYLFPPPYQIGDLVKYLEAQKLNVFALPEARWRGKGLKELFLNIDDTSCSGAIDKRSSIEASDDEAIEGWAWDRVKHRPATRIVLVGADDKIIGLASGEWFRPDFRSLPDVGAEPGWKGFANQAKGKMLRAYAILGRDACELQVRR